MNSHAIAVQMIEDEISMIAPSEFPELPASVCRMAVFLAHRLDTISTTERDAYLKKIRGLELTRFTEILQGEVARPLSRESSAGSSGSGAQWLMHAQRLFAQPVLAT